jgi:hypothetical protein
MEGLMSETHREQPTKKVVHADPTKDFFVDMITRDIALEDCIFDFLDNAIDGARRVGPRNGHERPLTGYRIDISFDRSHFQIKDNCGGITLSDAIDYAFHFGRRTDAPVDVEGGIGLYGIGMKRGIFKIGRKAEVISETKDDSFRVEVDVINWKKDPKNWDFEYFDYSRKGLQGTTINIVEPNPGIDAALGDPGFQNKLTKLIARDYSFFIDKGLSIFVCGQPAPSYRYGLKSSKDIQPAIQEYADDGVNVRIVAGMVDELPDDIPEELVPSEVERYGWFVVCNDRVVLAADKTRLTIWGDEGFKTWHPQYNGFGGFVFFSAKDQRVLPWTTTKRSVDNAHPLFRRTVARMKSLTDQFSSYTSQRKADPDAARAVERAAQQVDVTQLRGQQTMKLPSTPTNLVKPEYVGISYRRKVAQVEAIRHHLGRTYMSAKEVGEHTFDYFLKMELGK